MWYFKAEWAYDDFGHHVSAEFMSLEDIRQWWNVETAENREAWQLSITDRLGNRILTDFARASKSEIEFWVRGMHRIVIDIENNKIYKEET